MIYMFIFNSFSHGQGEKERYSSRILLYSFFEGGLIVFEKVSVNSTQCQ